MILTAREFHVCPEKYENLEKVWENQRNFIFDYNFVWKNSIIQ